MADLTGQRLGQYLILERISKGATSTVYKAYQEKLERYVAVKVLSPHFIDEEGFLERFKQEARAVAQLDHPNILPVYDFDQVGDVVYIVMKYVDTGTLKDLLGAPMDLRATLEIVTQVGLALGFAHRQGVIHRDVKPGNILLGEGNWALLTDFGLAKMRAGDRKLTKSGIGLGTPDYMAPEQGQGLPVDGRADLYSLGCMLHEMVTGRVPFEADSGMAVVVKHITEPPRPPREINPRLPLAVEHVILRALEKDPSRRYQTAESMVADLARAIGSADQFMLLEELPAPAPARGQPRPTVRVADTRPAFPSPAPIVQMRERLGKHRPAVGAGIKSANVWLALRLRHVRQAARAVLERFWQGLRRLPVIAVAFVKRGHAGVSTALPARAPASSRSATSRLNTSAVRTKSARARTGAASKQRKAGARPSSVPSMVRFANRIRLAFEAARERLSRHRRLAAVAVLALLILLLALWLAGGSAGGAVPSQTARATDTAPGTPVVTVPGAGTPAASPVPDAPAGMLLVPGGTFKMGATGGHFDPDETPPHRVTVDPFYIDAVEVTVAQFARFASAWGDVTDAEKKGDATTWRAANTPDRQRFPVNRVSWNDAAAFCRWYGKRLPTEAEWELAAKGFTENIYSWGNAFDRNRANTQERGVGQPIAVASLPNSGPFGAYDMIGNVWEWVADWYGGDYYGVSPSVNPQGPASGLERVVRGGSFKSDGERATTTIRRKASQDGWSDDIGFRCVKDVSSP
ncbi:MAG TPA: bifunctional serine/threonine-protein kinase/formylglycine-generating enzyme family protein [Anaerolineae bacterium]|nr:bifunctional serine/threonine-protein kinase/formylglycine-generating enzyme family protein [Anaerolineae bacterium]